MSDIQSLLGDEAEFLLGHRSTTIPSDLLQLPGPDYVDRVTGPVRPQARCAQQPADPVRPRAPWRNRLSVDPAGRSGRRACRWCVVCAQSDLLRPGEYRAAGHGRRLQRSGLDARGARLHRAALRPQDPVPGQAQPQRAADLPERVRPDPVRQRRTGLRHGGGRRWARPSTSAPRSRAARSSRSARPFSRPTNWAWSTVLWAYLRNSGFKKDGVDYHESASLLAQRKGTKRKGTQDLPARFASGSLRFSQQAALGNSGLWPSDTPRSIPPAAAMLGGV
jgi:class I fructose-bisphosphate aldolase